MKPFIVVSSVFFLNSEVFYFSRPSTFFLVLITKKKLIYIHLAADVSPFTPGLLVINVLFDPRRVARYKLARGAPVRHKVTRCTAEKILGELTMCARTLQTRGVDNIGIGMGHLATTRERKKNKCICRPAGIHILAKYMLFFFMLHIEKKKAENAYISRDSKYTQRALTRRTDPRTPVNIRRMTATYRTRSVRAARQLYEVGRQATYSTVRTVAFFSPD